MPEKRLIDELKRLLTRRGPLTQCQREYAMAEEKAIARIHPVVHAADEKRFSHLRTLQRYIGEHDASMKEAEGNT